MSIFYLPCSGEKPPLPEAAFLCALFTVFVLKSGHPASFFLLGPPKLVLRVTVVPASLTHSPATTTRSVVENRDPNPAPLFAAGRISAYGGSPVFASEFWNGRNRPTVRMRVGRKGSQKTEAFVDESKTVCLGPAVAKAGGAAVG